MKVNYMGLELKNPFVIASSPLSSSVKNLETIENSGAGAVILGSIFQEQIESEIDEILKDTNMDTYLPEYLNNYCKDQVLDEYLNLIRVAKETLSIPVIASLNCNSDGDWVEYSKRLEACGADAIEINLFILASDYKKDSKNIEDLYIKILEKVVSSVKIPVSVKLGLYFTGMANFLKRVESIGVKSIVLFNRMYRPSIDIENIEIVSGKMLSSNEEIAHSLRWIALMSGELDVDLSAATGIHNSDDAIRQLLVGAKTVQLCTSLFKNGLSVINTYNSELENWMKRKSFNNVEDFRGLLCQERISNPDIYERTQYLKALTGK